MPTEQITVSIGGIAIEMTSHSRNDLYIPPAYERFVADGKPDVFLRIWEDSPPNRLLGKKMFDAEGLRAYQSGEEAIIVFQIPGTDIHSQNTIVLNRRFKTVDLYAQIYKQQHFHPLQRSLAEILVITMLTWEQGVMIHACGINDNQRGMIFAGVSGAGKTTMANLWRRKAAILSEDTVIIRKRQEQYWVYGTPWVKDVDLSSPDSCPLERIFFIEHAVENSSSQKKNVEAVTGILPHLLGPMWNATGMQFAMGFLSKMVRSTPCYTLGFAPDERIVDYVRTLL
jgi:hypothetical protein